MTWIELQQNKTHFEDCYQSPQVNMSSVESYPYYTIPLLGNVDVKFCDRLKLSDSNASRGKLCLLYTTQNLFLCTVSFSNNYLYYFLHVYISYLPCLHYQLSCKEKAFFLSNQFVTVLIKTYKCELYLFMGKITLSFNSPF